MGSVDAFRMLVRASALAPIVKVLRWDFSVLRIFRHRLSAFVCSVLLGCGHRCSAAEIRCAAVLCTVCCFPGTCLMVYAGRGSFVIVLIMICTHMHCIIVARLPLLLAINIARSPL